VGGRESKRAGIGYFSRWFASQRLKTRIAKMADGSFALEVFVDGMTCKYAPAFPSFLSSVGHQLII
jgi:hypothetical protein